MHRGSAGDGTRRKKGRASSNSRRDALSSASGSTDWDQDKANKLFDEMAEEDDPNVAGMEGISKLCELLSIDPFEDVRVLVLLWKLQATKKPAEIQREEWLAGCQNLNFDTLDKLKQLIPSLDTGFLDTEEFKDFYKFCFQFNRAGTHKTLEKDLAVALLRMTLSTDPPRVTSSRLHTFCEFLESSADENYSKITLDQWRSFLDFGLEYGEDESLADYNEGESAWPVLIDEYVEYMEKRNKKSIINK